MPTFRKQEKERHTGEESRLATEKGVDHASKLALSKSRLYLDCE
jgi:hypothetical protein